MKMERQSTSALNGEPSGTIGTNGSVREIIVIIHFKILKEEQVNCMPKEATFANQS